MKNITPKRHSAAVNLIKSKRASDTATPAAAAGLLWPNRIDATAAAFTKQTNHQRGAPILASKENPEADKASKQKTKNIIFKRGFKNDKLFWYK